MHCSCVKSPSLDPIQQTRSKPKRQNTIVSATGWVRGKNGGTSCRQKRVRIVIPLAFAVDSPCRLRLVHAHLLVENRELHAHTCKVVLPFCFSVQTTSRLHHIYSGSTWRKSNIVDVNVSRMGVYWYAWNYPAR